MAQTMTDEEIPTKIAGIVLITGDEPFMELTGSFSGMVGASVVKGPVGVDVGVGEVMGEILN